MTMIRANLYGRYLGLLKFNHVFKKTSIFHNFQDSKPGIGGIKFTLANNVLQISRDTIIHKRIPVEDFVTIGINGVGEIVMSTPQAWFLLDGNDKFLKHS